MTTIIFTELFTLKFAMLKFSLRTIFGFWTSKQSGIHICNHVVITIADKLKHELFECLIVRRIGIRISKILFVPAQMAFRCSKPG